MLKLFIFLLFLATFGSSFACAFKFTDACGREVQIPDKVKKISAVGPAASALAEYTDSAKYLVTQDLSPALNKASRFCSCGFPNGYERMQPIFKSFYNFVPDYQVINSAAPDLVISSGLNERQVEKLAQSVNAPVAALNCTETGFLHQDSIIQSIRIAGYIFNDQKNMQDLMNYVAKTRKEFIEKTKDAPKKKVFVISQQYKQSKDIYTVEKCYTYLKLLSIKGIGTDTSANTPFLEISTDNISAAQPDYIFVEYTMLDVLKQSYAENKDFFKNLPAVKNGRVYTILPYNRFMARYENLFINTYYIGTIVYPELFSSVNINSLADDITKEFIGSNLDEVIPPGTPLFKQIIFSDKGITIKK